MRPRGRYAEGVGERLRPARLAAFRPNLLCGLLWQIPGTPRRWHRKLGWFASDIPLCGCHVKASRVLPLLAGGFLVLPMKVLCVDAALHRELDTLGV